LARGSFSTIAPVGQVPTHRPQLTHSVSSSEPPSAGRITVSKPRLMNP